MNKPDEVTYSDDTRKRYQPLRERTEQLLEESGYEKNTNEFKRARRLFAREAYLAGIDKVTGLPVRSLFETRLQEEFDRSERNGEPLTMVLIDVNKLKEINKDGLPEGDKALRIIANSILKSIRRTDYAARYGGDEFAVLFPKSTVQDIDAWWKRFEEIMKSVPYSVTASAKTIQRDNMEASRTTLSDEVKLTKEVHGHVSNAFKHLK
jgi:diguanylate cyclase (GGDEF)-like protein